MLLALLAGCDNGAPEQKETEKPDKATSSNEEPSEITDSTIPEESKADETETTLSTEPPESDNKLDKDIVASSLISEGIAVVSCDKNSSVCYGITLDGTVKFELELSSDFYVSRLRSCEFVNGLMMIDGGFCDLNGKMIYPDAVGVSHFYNQALEEGYIFADVITSGFDGTKSEMGIMNTSFQWVVNPSEELYQALKFQRGTAFDYSTERHDGFYCYDGFLYVDDVDKFVELETGNVLSSQDGPKAQPAYSWRRTKKGYLDRNDQVVLDLSEYENIQNVGKFTNNIGTVIFYNQEAKQHFVTAIDEKGGFLFNPVPVNEQGEGYGMVFSALNGKTIITYDYDHNYPVRTFDLEGNLMGEFDASELADNGVSVSIEDSVVVFRMDTIYGQMDTWMFTPEFEPLF